METQIISSGFHKPQALGSTSRSNNPQTGFCLPHSSSARELLQNALNFISLNSSDTDCQTESNSQMIWNVKQFSDDMESSLNIWPCNPKLEPEQPSFSKTSPS